MSYRRIDSPSNDDVKTLVRLKQRRIRDRTQLFLIEGRREIERALAGGVYVQQLYLCPDYLRPDAMALIDAQNPNTEIVELSKVAFEKVSYRGTPDGFLAVAATRQQSLADLSLSEAPLLLVIDGLEKPGNVGALLRTADGADLDAVILTGAGTDLYNPNVIRASMGSVFSRPVIAAAATETVTLLRDRGITVVTTSPSAEQLYWDIDYRLGVALVLGAEHEGLASDWFEGADERVAIPMHGLADSLNVATSGALLVYEALRQRRVRAG